MTEFEEIALKKIVKDYLIENIYYRINLLIGKYGISNAEISKRIGWDPAGYNQKYNRSNDLRMTTFIKIYVAIQEIIAEKEAEYGYEELELSKIDLNDLITQDEFALGRLFNHISAAAEGKMEFLSNVSLTHTYLSLKSFVLLGRKNKKFSEREIDVYISFYKAISEQ
ncbi:MAG: hypothetical protein VB081_01225 [Christensenella sp.]|uniref:hypothetical protein n=1 Tax=Christensenella sp. TaxID=1935934 RepID=UPI002B1EDE31|nr:hypothetical protein [Christensenella sp.]MEA5002111.1 hypothetical protein [Christensenella sp.]